MSRMLRSKIPISQKLLQPAVVDAHVQLTHQKAKQKVYYDRSVRPQHKLAPGDIVRVRRRNVWEAAQITDVDTHPTSYWVDQADALLLQELASATKDN